MAATLYISFDLETLGGNPEDLPVINWGFVAYTEDKKKIGQLSVNTKCLKADPRTVEWFNSTSELKAAFDTCSADPLDPEAGISVVKDWITNISKGFKPVLVAYPTIFDGSLLYYYWFRYLGHPTGGKGNGFTMLDIRSYAAGALGISYHDASKEKALKEFKPKDVPHTHTGMDDAEEQMWLLFNIMDRKNK